MEPISEETVEETSEEISLYTPHRASQEILKVGKYQPDLISFVMGSTSGFNADVKELALHVFFVIYQIFEKGYGKKIGKISSREIIRCYQDNRKLLEGLRVAHERFYSRIARIQFSGQPYVTKYMVEALFNCPKENPAKLDQEAVGSVFIALKSTIDLLNKKTES